MIGRLKLNKSSPILLSSVRRFGFSSLSMQRPPLDLSLSFSSPTLFSSSIYLFIRNSLLVNLQNIPSYFQLSSTCASSSSSSAPSSSSFSSSSLEAAFVEPLNNNNISAISIERSHHHQEGDVADSFFTEGILNSSTKRKRNAKMNKHKLRKRMKKMRMNTKISRGK